MSDQTQSQRIKKNCTKTALSYAKSDERYWQKRIMFWNKSDKFYSVRMQHAKRTEVFKLHTANSREAQQKARDIFLSLKANGWDDTLDKFKPKVAEKEESPTIGDIIRVYLELTEASEQTAENYVRVFRSVVADIKKISGDKRRFDYVNGGNEKWKAKVNSVLLSEITQAKVQKWKVSYVKERSSDPVKKNSAMESANSYIRYCRSMFKPDILPHMQKELALPENLPFSAVKLYPRQNTKYVSTFSVVDVMERAKSELVGIEQDQQWLVFTLAVSTGMRRNEIDKLTWPQINFDKNFINVCATKHLGVKGTEGCVDIEPELATMLKGYYAKYNDAGEFVIQSDIKPSFKSKVPKYRANRHLQAVVAWLRKQGVEAHKPIHTLRKEAGSEVCKRYGLHATSTFLRHADIQVASNHYVENKETITSGLGALLAGNVESISKVKEAKNG